MANFESSQLDPRQHYFQAPILVKLQLITGLSNIKGNREPEVMRYVTDGRLERFKLAKQPGRCKHLEPKFHWNKTTDPRSKYCSRPGYPTILMALVLANGTEAPTLVSTARHCSGAMFLMNVLALGANTRPQTLRRCSGPRSTEVGTVPWWARDYLSHLNSRIHRLMASGGADIGQDEAIVKKFGHSSQSFPVLGRCISKVTECISKMMINVFFRLPTQKRAKIHNPHIKHVILDKRNFSCPKSHQLYTADGAKSWAVGNIDSSYESQAGQ
ncbi:hypothetical protein C8J56DRAFT_899048 [Mycena floridula]|nr:hypothetical protein C8J56DRAFT_899048 [Mycena floridula]